MILQSYRRLYSVLSNCIKCALSTENGLPRHSLYKLTHYGLHKLYLYRFKEMGVRGELE